jgi:hypothetical protein
VTESLVIAWLATMGFALLTLVSPGAINAVYGCGIVAVVLTGCALFELVSDFVWFRRR